MRPIFNGLRFFFMRLAILAALLLLICFPAFSQDLADYTFAGIGTGFSANVPGNVIGTMYLGLPVPSVDRLYLISSLMLSGANDGGDNTIYLGGKPFQAEFREYGAYRFLDIGKKVSVFALIGPGFSVLGDPAGEADPGTNPGTSIEFGFSAGGLIDIKLNDKIGLNFGPVVDWNSVKETEFSPFVTFRFKL